MVALRATSSKRADATHCVSQVCCSQSPSPQQATAGPCLCRRHSNSQRQVWLSLWGSLHLVAHKVLFESSKHLRQVWSLILNTISPLLPSCCGFALGREVSFLVGSNIFLPMVVQQLDAILEFLQEKMSAHPFTLPSWIHY